jgi:hypothetical protein
MSLIYMTMYKLYNKFYNIYMQNESVTGNNNSVPKPLLIQMKFIMLGIKKTTLPQVNFYQISLNVI